MTAMLELDGVTRRFGGVTALQDVSFSVAPGHIVGIIGPNGSGKTTLMNVLSGVDRPSSGEIRLDGHPVQGRPAHRLVRHGVARTFQHIRLVAGLTAAENVSLALRTREASLAAIMLRGPALRRSRKARHAEALALLEQVGAAQHADIPASALPYGTRRRIEIARALATGPRLLLLDEPAAGMTHGERCRLGELIASFPKQGITVLLVEHDMDLVLGLSDELRVLNMGRCIASGPPAVVRSDPRVVEAYLGAEHA